MKAELSLSVLTLAITAIVLISGCTGTQAPSSNQTGGSEITIKNFAFSPATLTVSAGTTVKWTNEDSMTHTITSDTFNSENLNNGESFEFIFNTKGEYTYHCSIHPSMTGKIVVN